MTRLLRNKFVWLVIVAFIAPTACLECYSCFYTSYHDSNSIKSCDDPMESGEVPRIDCTDTDKCFGSRLSYVGDGGAAWKVTRACANETVCDLGNYPGDIPGAVYNHYCCLSPRCNEANADTGLIPTTTPDYNTGHVTIVTSSLVTLSAMMTFFII